MYSNLLKLFDTEDIIEVALPGLSKEDITLTVERNLLTIEGEYPKHVKTRSGKVRATRLLSRNYKAEEIEASMQNGLLTITFKDSAPESNKITIT